MTNVKCCQLRYNSSNVLTRRRFIVPESATIRREGVKSIDTGEFVFGNDVKIDDGDEIYYIQDIVPIDTLKGIWNFWGSFRDESGYHNDDYVSGTYSLPSCATRNLRVTGKFRGKSCFLINAASNDGVKIPNKQNSNSSPTLDMSNDFDIYFWFQSTNTATAMLFEKHTSSTGIKVSTNSSNDTVTVTCNSTTITTSAVTGVDFTAAPVLLRVCRSGDSVKVYLNNQLGGSGTVSASMNTTADLYLFKEFDSSYTGTGFTGYVHQLRWYNSCLTSEDARKIFAGKPQSQTMKFGGKVWKKEQQSHVIRVNCSGFSTFLLNTHVNSNVISGSATLGNNAARENNIYRKSGNNRVRLDQLLDDIIKEITDTNEYQTNIDTGSTSLQGNFIAEGLFLELVKIILQMKGTNTMFSISPRKIFFVDQEADIETNMVFSNSNYNLTNKGQDSTGTTNYLVAFGDTSLKTISTGTVRNSANSTNEYLKNISTTDNTWTSTGYRLTGRQFFEAFPTSIISVKRGDYENNGVPANSVFTVEKDLTNANWSGGLSSDSPIAKGDVYYFDKDENKIYFCSDGDTTNKDYKITFQYKYERSSNSTTDGRFRGLVIKKDDTSITNIGTFMRKIQIPQLQHDFDNDLLSFCNNFIADHKDIKTRIRVTTNQLVNSVLEGEKVKVFYPTYKIGSVNSSGSVTTESHNIKSIEWRYPEGLTIIELGDFAYSSFDLEKTTAESIRQVVSVSGDTTV